MLPLPVRFATVILERFQPDWKHGCCIGGCRIRPRQAIALFPVSVNMLYRSLRCLCSSGRGGTRNCCCWARC
jgi:hypothetical protein